MSDQIRSIAQRIKESREISDQSRELVSNELGAPIKIRYTVDMSRS